MERFGEGELMAPTVCLLATWLVARLVGLLGVEAVGDWQSSLRVGVAAMFVLTGLAHFGPPRRDMIAMVPPRLPRAPLLVTVTGVLELAGAVGLLVPATSTAAGICLALLLVVMFPANVHAARSGGEFRGRPATPLGVRTVLQLVFLAAVLASTA
ncbi:DoxX family protein [Actinoalloteichus caeruleus]|uniref:DoxX family protein n=1 Tax=Actinoalloteichus cyanogriseus TaxID=2893586 RepID=UPI000AD20313|nr:DoxX family protein [Actinoalloteichus caeruleus]